MKALFVLMALVLAPATALGASQPVMIGDARIHDPTAIEVDGTWLALGTGEEGGIGQGAIRILTSPDGKAWHQAGWLGKGVPKWTQQALGYKSRNIWAPTISKHGDTYELYYAVSSFGLQISVIGLMTNDDLDPAHPAEGWIDQGLVVKSDGGDDFNAIDPFRLDAPDGKAWLSFGSYWDGIRLVELDPQSGKPLPDAPLHKLASRHGGAIEASSLLYHGGHYYLFVSYDRCCAGVASTYRIMVGRADAITGPYTDKQGRPMTDGWAVQVQRGHGRFIGPGGQEAIVTPGGDMLVYHYYDGNDRGISKLELTPIRWTDDGWPVLDPLPE